MAEASKQLLTPKCRECGSDQVSVDATARWCSITHGWVMISHDGVMICDDCGHEGDVPQALFAFTEVAPISLALTETVTALNNLTATARTFRDVPKEDQEWTSIDDEVLDHAFAVVDKASLLQGKQA